MMQHGAGNYYDLASVRSCLHKHFSVDFSEHMSPKQVLARRKVGNTVYECDISAFHAQISEQDLRFVLRRLGRIEWPVFKRIYHQYRRH